MSGKQEWISAWISNLWKRLEKIFNPENEVRVLAERVYFRDILLIRVSIPFEKVVCLAINILSEAKPFFILHGRIIQSTQGRIIRFLSERRKRPEWP